jgi:hypothetical protein
MKLRGPGFAPHPGQPLFFKKKYSAQCTLEARLQCSGTTTKQFYSDRPYVHTHRHTYIDNKNKLAEMVNFVRMS